jgi:hypothetical protein
MKAGWRDVWTQSHGLARRYHVVVGDGVDGEGMAACRPDQKMNGHGIPLTSIIAAEDVPVILRCQRSGCRQRWPKSTPKGDST